MGNGKFRPPHEEKHYLGFGGFHFLHFTVLTTDTSKFEVILIIPQVSRTQKTGFTPILKIFFKLVKRATCNNLISFSLNKNSNRSNHDKLNKLMKLPKKLRMRIGHHNHTSTGINMSDGHHLE
jgi:hypothetical protein